EGRSSADGSADPVSRQPTSASVPASPLPNDRTVSRNLPFHSDQSTGKLPTWEVPMSHGSANMITRFRLGSYETASSNGYDSANNAPCPARPSPAPRPKRNPPHSLRP